MKTAITFAKDVLALSSEKEIRDYVAVHGHEIWQLPATSLLNIQPLCLVEAVDFGGNMRSCITKIQELLIVSN